MAEPALIFVRYVDACGLCLWYGLQDAVLPSPSGADENIGAMMVRFPQ
jgi:hypothetical protein